MDIQEIYQKLLQNKIPFDILINVIFILEDARQAYFISFKKYLRKYRNNIFEIIENITYVCYNIKVLKFGDKAIILYHKKNERIFDKLTLGNINNYLDHPKVYDNINYGIKYSLQVNNIKIYKTASYNLDSDNELFILKISELKLKIKEVFDKLKLTFTLNFNKEIWYSKYYLINKLPNNLNLEEQRYLLKLLNSSKFDKLSNYLSFDLTLINRYKLQLSIILSYIKTHKIIDKSLEIIEWENLLIELFKKDEM
jgi:hypothetical protein